MPKLPNLLPNRPVKLKNPLKLQQKAQKKTQKKQKKENLRKKLLKERKPLPVNPKLKLNQLSREQHQRKLPQPKLQLPKDKGLLKQQQMLKLNFPPLLLF